MVQFGEIIEAVITDSNDSYYYVQHEGMTYRLVSVTEDKEDYSKGETVEGIVYQDKDGNHVLQSDLPDIRPGYYGWGTVIQAISGLGLFVNVGLVNKDVVVSLDDLPLEERRWPRHGDKLYLTYSIDNKQRFWGHIATDEEFAKLKRKAPARLMNQEVSATVISDKGVGVQAITLEGYQVFVHESEMQRKLRVGETVTLRIIHVHKDGTVNGSMHPRAHEAMDEDAEMIAALLSKTPGKFLPLHDKSDAQEIKDYLGLSKSQFKRAVGRLLKGGRIIQEKGEGIRLTGE